MFMEEGEWFWLPTLEGCLSHKSQAAEAGALVGAARAEAVVDGQAAVEPEERGARAAPEERVELEELGVKVEPEEQGEPAALEELVEEQLDALAAESRIRIRTIQTMCLRSRGRSFRNFLHQLLQISKFLRRSRTEPAGSRFSTPMTC
jgi:hypothetical protein